VYLFHQVLARLNQVITGPFPDGDAFYNVWHLWIAKRAFEHGEDPAFTNLIFALAEKPAHIFVEYVYSDVVGWLLQLAAQPLAAYNLLVISSFVLAGCTTYLLAFHYLQNRVASFAVGWFYTFSTYHFSRAGGHLGLCTIQWIPLCAWRLIVFVERPTPRNAVWAAAGVALVALSDVYYIACFLVPFGLAVLIRLLLRERAWFSARRHLGLAAMVGVLALAVAGPPLRSYAHLDPEMTAANRRMVDDTRTRLGADLASYVLPYASSGYFAGLAAPIYARMSAIEKDGFLGGIPIVLAVTALCFAQPRRTGAFFWLGVAVIGIVLSAGPRVTIGGRVLGPSPLYNVLFAVPPLSMFRAPNRTSVTVLLATAMLAGFAITTISSRLPTWRWKVLGSLVLAVLLPAHLWASLPWGMPYPASPVAVPELYRVIGRDPDDRLLLDLPLIPLESFQFYQTIHQKRITIAFVSRITPSMVQSVSKVPGSALFWVTNGSAAMQVGFARDWRVVATARRPPGTPQLRVELQRLGFRYVVLHHSTDPDTQQWMREYLLASLGLPFYEVKQEGLTAWCVDVTCPAAR
jgi:hypothetical protein